MRNILKTFPYPFNVVPFSLKRTKNSRLWEMTVEKRNRDCVLLLLVFDDSGNFRLCLQGGIHFWRLCNSFSIALEAFAQLNSQFPQAFLIQKVNGLLLRS